MRTTVRNYDPAADYERVGRLLVRTFRTSGGHINWLQPRWEYMHFHPLIRDVDLRSIGVWEASGEVVGVVHPEHATGTIYFQVDPDRDPLKREMLSYAEEHLNRPIEGGRRLRVFINDEDDEFQHAASAMGYRRSDESEPMSRLFVSALSPGVPLPRGFRLKSLAEENDLHKLDRVLWRGFGHGDEPPEDGIDDRRFMQSAPNYKKELNIVVQAPDGSFAAYCGMWYEPVHSIAYVEPVATDPDYRRMGIGRAAVLEGVRRCGELGASAVFVGAAMPFYLSLGFQSAYCSSVWQRNWA
ncbi:MAG: GNAT family N-acetyltransferase [Planctomycetota bacterium]|jgi:predicted N-acetyltransferase YhbS